MNRQLVVLIGDANGADKAMQSHFAAHAYARVVVYAIGGHLRNNMGSWPVEFVLAPQRAKGFELYSAKDRRMAEDASAGLMLWDGKSRGTLENIQNLVAHGKPVALYYSPARRFMNLHTKADLARLPAFAAYSRGSSRATPRNAANTQTPLRFD